MAKFSKDSVGFEHPAKGDDHCSECKHFLASEQACQIVAGHIQAEDWCRKFSPKSRLARSLREKQHG